MVTDYGDNDDDNGGPSLDMNPEAVCYVIVKARGFDAKVDVVEPDPGSNPADENMLEVLEDYADDPVFDELKSFIDALSEDEQVRLVALAWIGRGDHTVADWDEVIAMAEERHNERTAEYLLGMPLLPDYLEEGLAQFGLSCEGFEMGHL